jgi:aminoglycoside/choline kinase family phosphotransferase
MNTERLLTDDDYFNEWFIERNLDSLAKLAQLQGYNHHLSIFFEQHNIS